MRPEVGRLKGEAGTRRSHQVTRRDLTGVDRKVNLVAGVTKDQIHRIKAGELVNAVAQQVGGKGGGRPDMAQAGGNDPAALDKALKSVPDWVRAQM